MAALTVSKLVPVTGRVGIRGPSGEGSVSFFETSGSETIELLGRERECAAIDRVLDAARVHRSGALVLYGEAGVGKSALLAYARRSAADMAVLDCGGVRGRG